MQPTYKCLIDKIVKELPSLEALANRYPYTDKETLKYCLDNAKEILEVAQTRAGVLLYGLHVSYSYLKTFTLEFEVNKQTVPRSFDIQQKVKVRDLQEALASAEITIDALQGSEWVVTLSRVYDSEGLVVWDCDVDEFTKPYTREQDTSFLLIFSVDNSNLANTTGDFLFYREIKADSLADAISKGNKTVEYLAGESVVELIQIKDSNGEVLWCKEEEEENNAQDFKLIFSVNGLGSVSEFSRIFTTESKNLAKEEGLRIERMFSDATKAITWTFIKIEDQQGNEVW